jgi:hypothetical protein
MALGQNIVLQPIPRRFQAGLCPVARSIAAQRDPGSHLARAPVAMHLDRYKASGAELIMGTGRFIAPKTIEVKLNDGGTRVLTGDRVALNLGTHATIPDIPGLAEAEPLTNIETLELDRLPRPLDRARRRICRPGAGTSLSPFRQPRQYRGGRTPDRRPGISRRRGCSSGDAARRRHRGASWNKGSPRAGPVRPDRQSPNAHAGRRSDRRRQ